MEDISRNIVLFAHTKRLKPSYFYQGVKTKLYILLGVQKTIETQEELAIQNGAYFIKNILSGFTILALITILLSGTWRYHVFPLAFMVGYLLILAFSSFAQSGRFHIPIIPFELMFASYAIVGFEKKRKSWYTIWCVGIFVVCVLWTWFKIRGRGM